MVTVVLHSVIHRLSTHATALPGMRSAPATPPDSINFYPFGVIYFMRGRWFGNDATWKTSDNTFAIDIHLARLPDIGRVLETYAEYPETLAQAIVSDETLNDTVTHVNDVRGALQRLNYAGIDTIGYRMEIDCTMKSSKS